MADRDSTAFTAEGFAVTITKTPAPRCSESCSSFVRVDSLYGGVGVRSLTASDRKHFRSDPSDRLMAFDSRICISVALGGGRRTNAELAKSTRKKFEVAFRPLDLLYRSSLKINTECDLELSIDTNVGVWNCVELSCVKLYFIW